MTSTRWGGSSIGAGYEVWRDGRLVHSERSLVPASELPAQRLRKSEFGLKVISQSPVLPCD